MIAHHASQGNNLSARTRRRISRFQTLWTMSFTLILLLTTVMVPVAVAEEAPTPSPTAGPLTPEELRYIEESQVDGELPANPYSMNSYPDTVPAAVQAAALAASTTAPDAVNGWSEEQLCVGNEQCLIGDFNGDNRDDVAVLYRDTRAEPERGDVKVALSGGTYLSSSSKWLDGVCTGIQLCKSGDVNHDGKDDLVIFDRGDGGDVRVAISSGSSFASPALWHDYFCIGDQVCDVGDFDGVNGDDIILFARSSSEDSFEGDVLVARSNGVNRFLSAETWHSYFCIQEQECRVGDFNGDKRDDIALFVKKNSGDQGRVSVALSSGSNFGSAKQWTDYFCVGDEECGIGDFDGDGLDDALTFLRGSLPDPSKYGNTYVTLSTGGSFYDSQLWSDSLCVPGEDCGIGDFNGDGRDDVIRFVKWSADPARVGLVLVAVASGTPTGFVPTPAPSGQWLTGFCTGAQSCLTGDFNGDGADDIAYLVRNTLSSGGEGDVYVSLSARTHFQPPVKWHEYFCVGSDVCKVGDFDGDGRDDLISFSRATGSYGSVFVTLSSGSGFQDARVWNSYFCVGSEWCEVGDFNGDRRDDIVLFIRSAYGNDTDRVGDVEVAISTGGLFVSTGALWHNFFCIGSEVCQTGDFNGDGRDDILAFTRSSSANVYVELSNGAWFGDANAPADQWHSFFCAANEVCDTGDFNGDGKDDVVTFLRSDYSYYANTIGDVLVELSNGWRFGDGVDPAEKWAHYFCIGGETCETGDFNGDGRKDIAAFTRGSTGNVYVALATIGTGYHFAEASGIPPKSRWLGSLIVRRKK